MNRAQLILWRWVNILTLSVAAAAVTLVAFGLVSGWVLHWLNTSVWLVGSGVFLILVLLFHEAFAVKQQRTDFEQNRITGLRHSSQPWSFWRRLTAYLGFRHLISYPPLWLAGVAGSGLTLLCLARNLELLVLHNFSEELVPGLLWLSSTCGLIFLGTLVLALVPRGVTLLWKSRKKGTPPVETDAESVVVLYEFWDRLRTWLNKEDPVAHPEDDVFGHGVLAERIVRRLRLAESGAMPAQAIVGDLGSGKTTLRKLVQHQLSASVVHIVAVELWPYATPMCCAVYCVAWSKTHR
jgi:hypothetical protein